MELIEYKYDMGQLHISQESLEKFFMTRDLTDAEFSFGTFVSHESDSIYFSKDWCIKNIDAFDNASISNIVQSVLSDFSLKIRIYSLDCRGTFSYVNINDLHERIVNKNIFNDIPQTSTYIQYVLYEGCYAFTYTKDVFSRIFFKENYTGDICHKDMMLLTDIMNLLGMSRNRVYIRSCYNENNTLKKIAISLKKIPSNIGDATDTYYNIDDCDYIYDIACMYGNSRGDIYYIDCDDVSYETFLRYVSNKDINLWANKLE